MEREKRAPVTRPFGNKTRVEGQESGEHRNASARHKAVRAFDKGEKHCRYLVRVPHD
jgi:hypothetical protein